MEQTEFTDMVWQVQQQLRLNQAQLAAKLGLNQSTVSRWFRGSVPELAQIKAVERLAKGLTGDGTEPEHIGEAVIRGLIGAGAEIDAGVEQPPAEGWGVVRTKFPLPNNSIAFEVVGTSMQPRYAPGDIIICPQEGTPLGEIPDGAEAALRLADGRRFLKTMVRTPTPGRYHLTSPNAEALIVDVQVEWAAHILFTVRADQWSRLSDFERRAFQKVSKPNVGTKTRIKRQDK